ncbi:histidine--tRNA ligase [Paenibacillus albiflavus]|uniref:Histidine--tRNA ligase n=1 Tax=Paenibacillus albiflavus TaxID=2545760 RepID=A0A4R4EJ03_9BACL|nr:histidine--tRNA ligase [Paenibacillus albiflavus]TCZ80154.1 histidine--tRNA ligase [Paenibacillus albiflavus]
MQNVKGTFDFWGEEQALRNKVQSELRKLFELYDYDAMETPMLNELSLMTSKYAGGDEIIKEIYQLTDQGGRELALRYDLTIPFAKVVALNPSLRFPFKRYELGKVFRDGPVKRGRLREFIQCDVDVVGIEGIEAEAELMQLAVNAFEKLEIDVVIRWNNRRFLGELLTSIGVAADQCLSIMLTLDKLAKIGAAGVQEELLAKGLYAKVTNAILELITRKDTTYEQLAANYGLEESKGSMEVQTLQRLIQKTGLEHSCLFDPFLSRGLSFYTGTVYEIFEATGAYTSSLGGGGRYDAIIGNLIDREDLNYPAVGLSFGMESIMAILKEREMRFESVPVLILPIGDTLPDCLVAANAIRRAGIRCRLDGSRRKLKKAIATAVAQEIRYLILLGEDEARNGNVILKDLQESSESVLTLEEVIALVGPND